MRLRCPREWRSALRPRCRGKARLGKAGAAKRYRIAAGRARTVRLRLPPAALKRLERKRSIELTIATRNRDRLGGTTARRRILLRAR